MRSLQTTMGGVHSYLATTIIVDCNATIDISDSIMVSPDMDSYAGLVGSMLLKRDEVSEEVTSRSHTRSTSPLTSSFFRLNSVLVATFCAC